LAKGDALAIAQDGQLRNWRALVVEGENGVVAERVLHAVEGVMAL
jgi:hypothetical protein